MIGQLSSVFRGVAREFWTPGLRGCWINDRGSWAKQVVIYIFCIYIYIYIYQLGVARYMYSSRTVTVWTSRFGAWGLTTNTGNSPPIQKGAPAVIQCCLITASASRRTANAVSWALENKAPWTVTMCCFWMRLSHGLTKEYTLKAYALNCLQNGALRSCILPLSFGIGTNPNITYFLVCNVTYMKAKLLCKW